MGVFSFLVAGIRTWAVVASYMHIRSTYASTYAYTHAHMLVQLT